MLTDTVAKIHTSQDKPTDAEVLQTKQSVGSMTLALFEGQLTGPSDERTGAPLLATRTLVVDVAADVTKKFVTPWLAVQAQRSLLALQQSLVPSSTDGLAVGVGKALLLTASAFAAPMIAPALDRFVDGLAAVIKDPAVLQRTLVWALDAPREAVSHPIETFSALTQASAHEWAVWAKQQALRAVGFGTSTAMILAAGRIAAQGQLEEGVEGPLPDIPRLAVYLRGAAPTIAKLVAGLAEYTLHRYLPMVDVDPETLPRKGETYPFLYCFGTVVDNQAEDVTGFYRTVLRANGEAFVPFIQAAGELTVRFMDDGVIHDVPDATKLKLTIDRFTLTGLRASFRSGVGLVVDAATMTSSRDGEQPVLGQLVISPFGWLSGTFKLENKACKFGSEYGHGVLVPEDEVATEHGADTSGEREPGSEAPGLAGHIHGALRKATGSVGMFVAHHGVGLANFMTLGGNLAHRKPNAPAETTTSGGVSQLAARVIGIDPASLLDTIGSLDLVPDVFKAGHRRLRLQADDLSFGHEPSVRIGMSVGIRPFATSPEGSVDGLRVTWLIDQAPYVVVQARDLVIHPEHAAFHGIEVDPANGLRIASARVALPGPKVQGLFSVDQIAAFADGVTLHKAFNARRAGATLENLVIADVLTVGKFGIQVENSETDEKTYTASLTQGALRMPGPDNAAPGGLELSFDGRLTWNREGVSGHGDAALKRKVEMFDGTFSLEQANIGITVENKSFTGETEVRGVTLKLHGHTATGDGEIVVDERGLARLEVTTARLLDEKQRVTAELGGFIYDRNGVLRFESARVMIPARGVIRGKPDGDSAAPSYLCFSNIDLSALVPKLPPKDEATPTTDLTTPSDPTRDTEETQLRATTQDPPLGPFAIYGENLKTLEIGPPDGAPIAELELAPRVSDETPSGLKGKLRLHLGITKAHGDVAIESDPEDLAKVTATATNVAVGKSFSIELVDYRKSTLTVKNAALDISSILSAIWPGELSGLKVGLTAGFVAGTDDRTLRSFEAGLTASGKVFGEAVTLTDAKGSIGVTGRLGTPTEAAVPEGKVTGTISGGIELKLFGAEIKIPNAKLTIADKVEGTLTGSGGVAGATITATNLRFIGGKQAMVDKLVTSIPAPGETSPLRFLAPGSNSNVPSTKNVEITLQGVGFDVETGQLLFARDETVKGDGAPTIKSGEDEIERDIGEVDFGGITVADGAIVARVSEKITAKKLRGRDEVKLSGGVDLALGPLSAKLQGVDIYLPLGAPTVRDAEGKETPVPTEEANNARGRIHVARASLGHGGALEAENLWVQRGTLSIGRITLGTDRLLANLPDELAVLKGVRPVITDVVVTTGKQISIGGIGVELPDFLPFAGRLQVLGPTLTFSPAPFQLPGNRDAALLPASWRATLGATSVIAKPVDSLSFAVGKSTLTASAEGLEAELQNPTVGWVEGMLAGADRVWVGKGGFGVTGAKLGVSPTLLAELPGLGDVFALLPSWLVPDGKSNPVVIGVRGIDLSYANGKLTWPSVSKLKFGVRRGGVKLGPVVAGFDLDAGTFLLGVHHEGKFEVGAQFPIGQGVGIELGGGLYYKVHFDADAQIAKDVEDVVRFASRLKGRASLEGSIKAGIYGGVPSVFSAAAGLYAGVELSAVVQARAEGQWALPTGASTHGGGAFDAFFQLKDGDMYPALKGVAGAYVSLHFLGTSRTLRKQLGELRIAELHAHGGMRFRTGEDLQLLPSADQFPSYKVHLDPTLHDVLFGKDFEDEYLRSQKRLSGAFAKAEAAEELLGINDAHPEPKASSSKKALPVTPDPKQLEADVSKTEKALGEAKQELADLDERDHAGLELLEDLRKQLAKDEWRLAKLRKLEAQKKTKDRSVRDAIRHPTWGAANVKDVNGRPTVKARRVVGPEEAKARVDAPSFSKRMGLAQDSTWLHADDLEQKVAYKRAEIAELEGRRDDPRLELEQKRIDADAAHRKAETKRDLAKKDRPVVEEQLAEARRHLLESLYVASKAEVKQEDARIKGAATREQLTEDLDAARAEIERLSAPTSTEQEARATDLQRALTQFWEEHVRFLQGELTFLEDQEAKHHYTEATFESRLGPHQGTLERAAAADTSKKKVEELKQRTQDKVEKRTAAIRKSQAVLARKLREIERLEERGKSTETKEKERKRCARALEQQRQQLKAYLDNLARLDQLIDPDGVDRVTELYEDLSAPEREGTAKVHRTQGIAKAPPPPSIEEVD